MTHIFISYAKKDTRDLALALADALNQINGLTAWVDRSLRAGRAWELQIQEQIDKCDTMIVLYSPDINRHKSGEPESYVLTEIAYAKYTAKKSILPVMAQLTDPPISLTMEHYIDYTLDGLTLDDLVAALCDELEIAPPSDVASASDETAPIKEPNVGADHDPPANAERTNLPPKPTTIDLMPKPFKWIEIPGKQGAMKTDESNVVLEIPPERYWIAKYPVTNAQFRKFYDAAGYETEHWWTPRGWQIRQQEGWVEPLYWTDKWYTKSDNPVVGVSWYEAVAFCLWLSEMTDEKIMLPTESEWQYAAQGEDGRIYPWGDKWDCKLCNNSVKPCNSNRTTSVQQYEVKNKSPFGVVDMVGNVWEWCLTDYEDRINDYESDANRRVLRGGAWININKGDLCCHYRYGYDARLRDYGRGFRIVSKGLAT